MLTPEQREEYRKAHGSDATFLLAEIDRLHAELCDAEEANFKLCDEVRKMEAFMKLRTLDGESTEWEVWQEEGKALIAEKDRYEKNSA
jgi:hypothetical protein